MPLHLDYRPKSLNEIIGNNHIKVSLESIFSREKDIPHAFLFCGITGTGKTTFARIIANLLYCKDVYEYNTANTRGIDTIREITEHCQYSPISGKTKVYIMDEVHRLTIDGMNAILKILEDTPKHVYFILCTTEPEKLLETIKNRCFQYQTKTLTSTQIKALLYYVLSSEKIKDFPKSIIEKIIDLSSGIPRQALVLLDSVIDIIEEEIALETLAALMPNEASIIDICRILVDKKMEGKWDKIRIHLKGLLEEEPEKVRRIIASYLIKVLLGSKQNDRIAEMLIYFADNWFYSGKGAMINNIYFASKI